MTIDPALIMRIDATERATLLSRQRVAELETAKKGLQVDIAKLAAANTQQQHICRELQQAMKSLGSGEGNAEEEETTRRNELASKFDGTIGDIGERMGGEEAEVERLVAENDRSKARLVSFREQHKTVVTHQAAEAHTRNLQVRLAAAQLREAEQHLHEQAQRCRLTEVHLQSQRAAEDDARGHVVAYHARCGKLHETLDKSTEVTLKHRACCARSGLRASPDSHPNLKRRSSRSFGSRQRQPRRAPRIKTL